MNNKKAAALAISSVIASQDIIDLGYMYIVFPGLIGSIILCIVAIIFNNLDNNINYPLYWR